MRGVDGKPIGLTPKELAGRIGISYSGLYQWRARGIGPPYYKIRNEIYYKIEDVEEWIDKQKSTEGPLARPSPS